MTRDRSRQGGGMEGSGASAAEIDALRTVLAAAAAMADRLRSEAAGEFLRRALSLLRDGDHAPAQAAARDEPMPRPRGLRQP